MRKLKKLMSIALTAAMTSALTFPAMAATITIGNAVNGKTYTAYRIFEYTESTIPGVDEGEDQTIRSYTMDSATYGVWGSIVESFTYDYDDDGEKEGVFTSTLVGDRYYFSVNREAISDFTDRSPMAIEFSEYLQDHIPSNLSGSVYYRDTFVGDNVTTDDFTLTSEAEPGYYFVNTNVGALLMLEHVDDDITIGEKNELPHVSSKQVKTGEDTWEDINSVSSGDTVDFKIEVVVNPGNNKEITVHDRMGAGFELVSSSIKMSVGNGEAVEVSNDDEQEFYYVAGNEDIDPCDFHLILTASYVESLVTNEDNVTLTITYSAKATDSIDGNNAGVNEAWTEYDGNSTPEDKTESYTATFDIKKIDGVNSDVLSGAKFILLDENKNEVYLRNVKDTDNIGTNVWIADTDAGTGELIITSESGVVTIKNLAAGDYYLREVEAPEGYNPLTYDIPVRIEEYTKTGDTVSGGDVSADLDGADDEGLINYVTIESKEVTVENNRGTLLPSTGGIGTTVFYAAGIILMAGAVFFVIRTKKNA